MVHGPNACDEETSTSLVAAMEWAQMIGTGYGCVDCLGQMQKRFMLEPDHGTWFQYGTDYHWVTFEKVA